MKNIYSLFNTTNPNSNIITQYNFNYYSNSYYLNLLVQKSANYEVLSSIAQSPEDLYNQIILNVPNTLEDIGYNIGIKINESEIPLYLSNFNLKFQKQIILNM